MARDRLRIAIAVAAAAPAARSAVPASTLGHRRACGLGGSSLRAAAASTEDTRGATLSCTDTLPLAALTAIQARARPTLGFAQLAAPPAPWPAVMAALLVIGPALLASFDACIAIFLARHCMSAAGTTDCFWVVSDTMSSPVINPHQELPRHHRVNPLGRGWRLNSPHMLAKMLQSGLARLCRQGGRLA